MLSKVTQSWKSYSEVAKYGTWLSDHWSWRIMESGFEVGNPVVSDVIVYKITWIWQVSDLVEEFHFQAVLNSSFSHVHRSPMSVWTLVTMLKKFQKILHTKDSRFSPEWLDKYAPMPAEAWREIQGKQITKKVPPLELTSTKPPGHTRFVCISDTHDVVKNDFYVPDGDILIHSGDFTKTGQIAEVKRFNEFLSLQKHPHKIVIAGNHDLSFDEKTFCQSGYGFIPPSAEDLDAEEIKEKVQETKDLLENCVYLQDEEVNIFGFRIYGSAPPFWRVDKLYFYLWHKFETLQVA